MSVSYQAVGWNPTKKIYDGILAGCSFTWSSSLASDPLFIPPRLRRPC
jgi:hypothetical protein